MIKEEDWERFESCLGRDLSIADEILEKYYGDDHPEDRNVAFRELLRILFKITVEECSQ